MLFQDVSLVKWHTALLKLKTIHVFNEKVNKMSAKPYNGDFFFVLFCFYDYLKIVFLFINQGSMFNHKNSYKVHVTLFDFGNQDQACIFLILNLYVWNSSF